MNLKDETTKQFEDIIEKLTTIENTMISLKENENEVDLL